MNKIYKKRITKRKGGGPNNKSKGMTIRSPGYRNNTKNFTMNNPMSKRLSLVPVQRVPMITMNLNRPLKATRRNNQNTKYIVKRTTGPISGIANAFRKGIERRRGNVSKAVNASKLANNFNMRNAQEASVGIVPGINALSVSSGNTLRNSINRRSINSRSTLSSGIAERYTGPGIRFKKAIVESNSKPLGHIGKKFGNQVAIVKSWRGNIKTETDENNDGQSISSGENTWSVYNENENNKSVEIF